MRGTADVTRLFIDRHVSFPEQSRLLHSLLDHLPADSPYVDLPLLVQGSITGDHLEALPLASLGKFLFLGLDIIDDLADGDAERHWPGQSQPELLLGSSLFLSALPQILIAGLAVSGTIRTRIQQRFARGLSEIAAGQQSELAMKGKATLCSRDVEESVRAKSSGIATLATITALFAGAAQDQISFCEEMARNLGTALQLSSDFHDLFQAPFSRDLRNGTRTLPIVLGLEQLPGSESRMLAGLLEKAAASRLKQEEIRSLLFSGGIGRLMACIIELYCERARTSAVLACPNKKYQATLLSCINNVSVFFKKGKIP